MGYLISNSGHLRKTKSDDNTMEKAVQHRIAELQTMTKQVLKLIYDEETGNWLAYHYNSVTQTENPISDENGKSIIAFANDAISKNTLQRMLKKLDIRIKP